MNDERRLLHRARRGDRFAFGLLMERHEARLFTVAARLLGSPEDAADAVQETLIRAWTALPRFRGDAQLSTWLHRILLNAVHDLRTRSRPSVPLESAAEPADPRDLIAERELSGELQSALAALDEDFRVAVLLADVSGLSYAEVAELTGVPVGTVRSRIFRGRRELARSLGTIADPRESERR